MKIISCHIENFGKLQDLTLNFQPDCTRIFAENGWGKSTLATFLRVMLYGFEGEGKRTGLSNERKRFHPWNGGVYGGSMRFEVKGKEYEVTRTFGDKEANDTFELRDAKTNLISGDYSAKLGEELFEINSESFMRTIYMGQTDLANAGTTDGIHAKIGNLETEQEDLSAYEQAEGRLKKFCDHLTPRRSTGELSKLSDEKTRLTRVIAEHAGVSQSISQTADLLENEQNEIAKLKQRSQELVELQKKAGRKKDLEAKLETYHELLSQSRQKDQQVQLTMVDFPQGLPQDEEIAQLFTLNAGMEKYHQAEEHYRLEPGEEAFLQKYGNAFEHGLPEDAFYRECREMVNELARQKEVAAAVRMTKEEEQKLENLQNIFWATEEPYQDPLEEVVAMRQQLLGKKTREERLPQKREENRRLENILKAEQRHKKGRSWKIFLIFAILLLIGALVTGILGHSLGTVLLIIGAGLGGGGLLFLILALILRGIYKKPNEEEEKTEEELAKLKKEIEEDEKFIVSSGIAVKSYLKRHEDLETEPDQTEEMRMQELLSDAMEYMNLLEKKSKVIEADADKKMEQLEKELLRRLAIYGMGSALSNLAMTPSAYQSSLDSLEKTASRYREAGLKQHNYAENHKLYEDYKEKLRQGLLKMGIASAETQGNMTAFLPELQKKAVRARHLKEEADEAKRKLIAYREENAQYPLTEELPSDTTGNWTDRPTQGQNTASLAELQQNYQEIQEEIEKKQELIRHYISQMDVLGEEQDEQEENQRELDALTEKINQKKAQFGFAEKAADFLTRARMKITAEQMQPLMDSFVRYTNVITEEDGTAYHIDADANITRDELGRQRQPEYFSTGIRDLIGLCKRLAVADTMYPSEKPPVIMDDPFTNFDDKKMKGAKRLLKAASENYQVIYFTCSKNR